jgi:hypothetical protein
MKYCVSRIKIRLLSFILGFIVVQVGFSSFAKAQNFFFDGNRKKDGISFELIKNLIVIPVYINEKGPFNFILDTGVGPMIISDPKLIDSLRLKDLRPVKITGFGEGEDIDAMVTSSHFTRVGKSHADNLQTLVLKEDVFYLSNYMGKDIAGLIGFNFFNGFVVKINYMTQRIAFSLHSKTEQKIKGEKIPIELIDNKPYVIAQMESSTLGKIDVKLIIDCGANHALSLENYQGVSFPPTATSIVGNLGVGLSGEISGLIGRTSTFSIGSFTFKDVLTNFPKYTDVGAKSSIKERNGNLGSEILKRFNISYDYKNRAIYLQKNDYYTRPFDHDMSGIEIYLPNIPYNAYLIGRIEPNSPAELAGLRPKDEIVAINFKKAEDFSLNREMEER